MYVCMYVYIHIYMSNTKLSNARTPPLPCTDELLYAFERAKAQGHAKHAVLYLAGSGELEPLVAKHAARWST